VLEEDRLAPKTKQKKVYCWIVGSGPDNARNETSKPKKKLPLDHVRHFQQDFSHCDEISRVVAPIILLFS
jgi:hypothetical protein